ncbi:MAG: LysR family transcriptional regulator, partial [Gammaproteobacteria bacterium]
MDRFEEIHTFIRVVDNGSLSAAADKLNLAKSAVSRRLSELESRLGVQLLQRTTRRINLTDAGQRFYQRCSQILADLEDSEREASTEQSQLCGTVRIAAPLSFGIQHLSPLLDQFLIQHSELNLDLKLTDRVINLMEEGVDLGIRIGRLKDSSFQARKLSSCQQLICASPSYLKQYGTPQTMDDLVHHHGLVYSNIPEAQLWTYRHQDGRSGSVRVPSRLRADNGDVLLQAAIDGLGILPTVSFIAYRAIKQGLLVPILQAYSREDLGIYAIYPAQRHLPLRIRTLIDFLVTEYGSQPY